jgi:hypothetical protein
MTKKDQKQKFNTLVDSLMDTWGCDDVECTECSFYITGEKARKLSGDTTGEMSCGAVAIRTFAQTIYRGKHPKKVRGL